jgi:glucosamine-phosphate N-acetyltransferase
VADFDRGFLRLLGQLTDVGVVSRAQFLERFRTMAACRPAAYYVLVVEEIA